jgi:hypothetical protein
MPKPGIAAALAFGLALTFSSGAFAETLGEKLWNERVGDVETGSYMAGDNVRFFLDPYGDKYLFRLADDPEVFVLYADRSSLGGRVLKFDSGMTVLNISGWGGVTLYTDAAPSGLPAVREGEDADPPILTMVSLEDMQSAAADEAAHLAYAHQLNLIFAADWRVLGADGYLRALAFDAMQNAARGLDRFAASPQARAILSQKVDLVTLETGAKPTIELTGKTLIVTFDAKRGYAGRASSRAIARALGRLFEIPVASE